MFVFLYCFISQHWMVPSDDLVSEAKQCMDTRTIMGCISTRLLSTRLPDTNLSY